MVLSTNSLTALIWSALAARNKINDYVCVDLPRTTPLSKKAFDDVIVLPWLNCHVAFNVQILYSLLSAVFFQNS